MQPLRTAAASSPAGRPAGSGMGEAGSGGAGAPPPLADLSVMHVRLPAPYLAANWPLCHAGELYPFFIPYHFLPNELLQEAGVT